ncbi:MAG: MATE family efflux transporter, partial [Firmicutes bacterium]|nr:MATE family efflux transporter [Bacillota bacterium]
HTSIFFCLIFGLELSVVGIFLVDSILLWMDTPEEVFHQASVYLKVFFGGVFFMGIYNTGAAILRGMGNSRDPLMYLIIVSVLNVVLDIVFVMGFGMDVEGVAIATVLAQAIASVLVLRKMMKFPKEYRVELKEIKCHRNPLRQTLRIGIPSGVQSTLVSLSNVLVQGAINSFGANAMAGWAAYSKLDMILLMPFHSLGVAMTTFAGQNIGANRLDRVSGAVKITAIINCSWAAVTGIILYILAEPALAIFCEEQAVLEQGVYMLRATVPFYFLLGLNQVFAGAINGAGDTVATMTVTFSTMCVMRVLILKIMGMFVSTFDVVFASYIVTWFACAGLQGAYYFSGRWKRKIVH